MLEVIQTLPLAKVMCTLKGLICSGAEQRPPQVEDIPGCRGPVICKRAGGIDTEITFRMDIQA